MRVTLVISNLATGGAERVLTMLANWWAEKGWQVTLLTLDDGTTPTVYKLHPAVVSRPTAFSEHRTPMGGGPRRRSSAVWRLVTLARPRGWVHTAWRHRVLRQAIIESRPDVVISFLDTVNVKTLIATRGLKIPVIVSERSDPHMQPLPSVLWIHLRTLLYPRAAAVVVQTENARQYFSTRVQRRCEIIPNPVRPLDPDRVTSARTARRGGRTVIAMGRLAREKGFDLLLDAFAQVAYKHLDWRLRIWGEGEDRKALEERARSLGLTGAADFPGITDDSYREFLASDLFVLSSRWEGFPNVLCEAMVCGLPVISFDCRSGPSDIIQDGVNGILVPPGDVDALARRLERLMSDAALRERLGTAARAVSDRYKLEKIVARWEDLVSRCVAGPAKTEAPRLRVGS